MIDYGFDVKVRYYGFHKGYDCFRSLGVLCGKAINAFCFRTKKRKRKKPSNWFL